MEDSSSSPVQATSEEQLVAPKIEYKCEDCSKIFPSMPALHGHKKAHGKKNKKSIGQEMPIPHQSPEKARPHVAAPESTPTGDAPEQIESVDSLTPGYVPQLQVHSTDEPTVLPDLDFLLYDMELVLDENQRPLAIWALP